MISAGKRGAVLISLGTVSGQVFTMLSMPLLSRLYSPEEMGHFVVYTSVVGLFTTTAALHYELAIPLPFSKIRASQIAIASFSIVILLAIVMTVALAVFGSPLLHLLKADDIIPIKYLLPVGFLLVGASNVWTFFSVRYQSHGRNALSKSVQGGGQAIAQVLAGWLAMGWVWLIVGQLVGTIISILPLINASLWKNFTPKKRITILQLNVLLKKYKKFPLAAVPSSFISAVANNAPPLLLAAFFGSNVAGLYGLGFRVLQVPMRFVGQAISQVFLGQAAQAKREGNLEKLVTKVFQATFGFSLHTFIPLALIAPSLFSFVFGDAWIAAGIYTRWLAPWLFASFVSTPLSMLITVLQKQQQELGLQIVYLCLVVGALAIGTINNDATFSLQALGVVGGIFLMVKTLWILGIAGCNKIQLSAKAIKETCFALVMHSPLVAMLFLLSNTELINTLVGGLWLVLIHLINFKYRKLYDF